MSIKFLLNLFRVSVHCMVTEAMKPGLKPRVPLPPEKPDKRNSLTPHGVNKGHCLYDLEEPFSITLMSVSNVNVADFSLVITTFLLSFFCFTGLVVHGYSRLGRLSVLAVRLWDLPPCVAGVDRLETLCVIQSTASKHFMYSVI